MKNIILAIASIVTTVLLFTQPVLADDFNMNGSGTTALTGDSQTDELLSQASALNPKDQPRPCATCAAHIVDGRLGDDTIPRAAGSGAGASTTPGKGTK